MTSSNPPRPFARVVKDMANAFPALHEFSTYLSSGYDPAATLVETAHTTRYGCPPGRGAVLIFRDDGVEQRVFDTHQAMELAFHDPAMQSDNIRGRVWILEDLEWAWMSALAEHLGIDPLVFSEQRNTFNFTDSNTIPFRPVPSLVQPDKAFTLRYYEARQLSNPHAMKATQNHMTFAINRRRFERWRDIDTANLQNK